MVVGVKWRRLEGNGVAWRGLERVLYIFLIRFEVLYYNMIRKKNESNLRRRIVALGGRDLRVSLANRRARMNEWKKKVRVFEEID
jgi:hypothetical protein